MSSIANGGAGEFVWDDKRESFMRATIFSIDLKCMTEHRIDHSFASPH